MDSSIITPFAKALDEQKAQYAGVISDGVKSIALPASEESMQIGKKNFLTESGWTFIVIGVIAAIAGLVMCVPGIWISGFTAIASGVYCIVKGEAQLKAEAFTKVGDSVYSSIEGTVAKVSKGWTADIVAQNAGLRKSIINSAASNDEKAEAVGNVVDEGYFHVDMADIRKAIDSAAAKSTLDSMRDTLSKAGQALSDALDVAAKARQDILTSLSAPAKAQPAPAK